MPPSAGSCATTGRWRATSAATRAASPPAHLWFIGYLFIFSLVALPLLARWRGRQLRARWLLFAMPLVLLAANELPAPNDGPQNPWYSLALFVAGFLLGG